MGFHNEINGNTPIPQFNSPGKPGPKADPNADPALTDLHGFAPEETDPDFELDDGIQFSVTDERGPLAFKDMQDFIDFIDKDKDGVFSKDEIIKAQEYIEENNITSVIIDNVKYNLITTNNENIEGTEGKDLVLSYSNDNSKSINTKDGDDIIVAAGYGKILGGEGEDNINGVSDSEFCLSMKEKYSTKAQEAYDYAIANINSGKTREEIEDHISNVIVAVPYIPDANVPTEFDTMDDFMKFIDTDGDGKLSAEEQKTAKALFEKAGIEKVTIDGEEYNMIYGDNSKKTFKLFGIGGNRNKIKGTKGNDIIWGTEGDDKIKGKKGDDIIFGLGGDDKLIGGKGDDLKFKGDNPEY